MLTKELINSIDPELYLLIKIAENSLNHQNSNEVEGMLNDSVLWENFFQYMIRHRMTPLAYQILSRYKNKIPPVWYNQLEHSYHKNVKKMLSLANENLKYSDILNEAGIECISLKGPLLSWQLYSDLSLRQSQDIDLLIPLCKAAQADTILINADLIRLTPASELQSKKLKHYLTNFHDFSYLIQSKSVQLELHWKLFGNQYLFPVEEEIIFDNTEVFSMGGKQFRVFNQNFNFLYLCVHGSLHGWLRLGWLRDVAWMLKNNDLDIDFIVNTAAKYGIIRPVQQALTLANLLFTVENSDFAYKLNKLHKPSKYLISKALSIIMHEEGKFNTKKIARIRMPLYISLLRTELKYKIRCFTKMATNASDWSLIALPDRLFFIYFVLRPFLYFYSAYIKKNKSRPNPSK